MLCAVLLGGLLAAPASAAAREGDRRTTIYVGTTRYSDGTTETAGTSFGARWAWEFVDSLQWTIGGAYSTTDGEYKDPDTGERTEVHARTTNVDTGLTYLFNNHPRSNLIGFVGGGVSVLSYDLDFAYEESDVGSTSGVGPGLFANVGAEVNITESVWFIPSYVVSAHRIETEDGDAYTLVSSGVLVSIRIGF